MVWGVAREFCLKVGLQDADNSCGLRGDFVGGWVSYGLKFQLIIGAGLNARCGFEVVMVSLRGLLI